MKRFTDTKAGWKRLDRVCRVIRRQLGLGDLCFSLGKGRDKTAWAQYWCRFKGWTCDITIHPSFFELRSDKQYEVLVHEHIHALMAPSNQVTYRHKNKMKAADRKLFHEMYDCANELTVEHATKPIALLLWPHVRKFF